MIGAADRLDALGQALYGEHWVAPLARDLKVDHDLVAKWASGKRELPADHPIFTALARALPGESRRQGACDHGA
jgi:hypothetical protein